MQAVVRLAMQHNPTKKAAGGNQTALQNTQTNTTKLPTILQTKTALDAAICLANSGILVFPCLENKAPACGGGFKSATSDINIIKAMWSNPNAALVGVPTGVISGFDVLDIDPRNGGMEWFEQNKHRLPQTRTQRTRSGGLHLFFKHQKDLRNSASKIAAGVDVRADGGCVIWWQASGYDLLDNSPMADWSDWLLEILTYKPPLAIFKCNFTGEAKGYAQAALRSAANCIATAPEGQRNHTLNKEVWSLIRFAKNGELSIREIANTLAAAGLASGLARPEVLATIVSAVRAGGAV